MHFHPVVNTLNHSWVDIERISFYLACLADEENHELSTRFPMLAGHWNQLKGSGENDFILLKVADKAGNFWFALVAELDDFMAFLVDIPDENRGLLHNYFSVSVGVGVNMIKLFELAVSHQFEDENSLISVQDIRHSAIYIHILRE